MKSSAPALYALHLAGNAVILWLGYGWLGIGESDAAHLAFSAIVLAAFACSALWLHGAALAYFDREGSRRFLASLGRAAAHLPGLLTLALITVLLYSLLAYWYASFDHSAFLIGSYSTMKLRKPVAPSNVLRWFHAFIWLLRWMAVPAIVAPIAGAVASRGWLGFRLQRRSRNPLYWFEVCALLLVAVWIPLKLIAWVPETNGFKMQLASFAARVGIGYLLFVAGLLTLAFSTSGGKPRLTQSSTVPSP